jgi:hypothetical protein
MVKETLIDMVLGLIINYLLTLIIFGVTKEFALFATSVFFTCSFIRSYLVRRYFRRVD